MEHYYTNAPTSRSDIREIRYEVNGHSLRYLTDHGVFSMERVDHGSDILIHAVIEQEAALTGTVIDLGCGYGAIGVAVAAVYPQVKVSMIDVNDRAMELARRNAEKNGVSERVAVGTADQLAVQEGAEVVITNPPIRAGKETIYGLFRDSFQWLRPGGRLYVVIRKNQGAPSAVKELTQIFGNCETVERQSGFHVLRCVKE